MLQVRENEISLCKWVWWCCAP